jgi:hypothetical protein
MGEGMEVPHRMCEEFEEDYEGLKITTQVRWLANPRIVTEGRQNGEIAVSEVVFVEKWNKAAQGLIKKSSKGAGGWYRVETYTNPGHTSR